MRPSTRVLGAIATALVFLTACGEPRTTVRHGSPATRPSLPLDAYSADEVSYQTRIAEDRLVRRCMAGRGIAWNPPPISPADAHPEFRRYGLTNPAIAAVFGYHVAVDSAHERRNHYYLHELTQRQKSGLEGTKGRPGCRQEADAVLYRGVPKTDELLVFELDGSSLKSAERSRQVRAAEARWSACMRARGYRYATPTAAAEDRRWKLDQPRASALETATATADVRCKESVSLVTIWAAAERPIQENLIRKNAAELEKIKKADSIQLANVTRALK